MIKIHSDVSIKFGKFLSKVISLNIMPSVCHIILVFVLSMRLDTSSIMFGTNVPDQSQKFKLML